MISQQQKSGEKIRKILNNPAILGLLAVLLIGLAVRIHFLIIASKQAHWWDTLAYGSIAKQMVYGLWPENEFILNELIIRPPLLPWVWSWLLKLNFSDLSTIIFLEIFPSLASILLIYLIANNLYNDKKISLICAFLMSTSWIILFYSIRIMADIPSLMLALLSIYFFTKNFDRFTTKYFALSIFFLSLAVLTRYSYGLIAFVYMLFMGITYKHKILAKKEFWVGGLIGAVPLLLFFLINLINAGSIFPATGVYSTSASEKADYAFYVLGFFPHILETVYLVLFILGTLYVLSEVVLAWGDNFLKIERIRSHLFALILLILPLIFYIFILKAAEDRYLLILLVPIYLFISIFLVNLKNAFGKKFTRAGLIIIVILLLVGTYSQLNFADQIITSKKETYKPMKEAFLWIKENTEKTAVIGGTGIEPYAIYYAERRVASGYSQEEIMNYVNQTDYLVLHMFEHQDPELINYVNDRMNVGFSPIQIFFFDGDSQRPAVIIYKTI